MTSRSSRQVQCVRTKCRNWKWANAAYAFRLTPYLCDVLLASFGGMWLSVCGCDRVWNVCKLRCTFTRSVPVSSPAIRMAKTCKTCCTISPPWANAEQIVCRSLCVLSSSRVFYMICWKRNRSCTFPRRSVTSLSLNSNAIAIVSQPFSLSCAINGTLEPIELVFYCAMKVSLENDSRLMLNAQRKDSIKVAHSTIVNANILTHRAFIMRRERRRRPHVTWGVWYIDFC